MSYQIQLTETAPSMLKGISDKRIRKKIGKRIDALAANPELQGKALKGSLSGCRSSYSRPTVQDYFSDSSE